MIERLAQAETYYPALQEPSTGVTAVSFQVCRLSDGYWYDFNDSTFKNSGWTTKAQAMAEDDNGLWIYMTGWAVPDADAQYKIQFSVTDGAGTFYPEGPKIIVNSSYLDDFKTILDELRVAQVNKQVIDEATGAVELFNASDVSLGSVSAGLSSSGGYTTRKRMAI